MRRGVRRARRQLLPEDDPFRLVRAFEARRAAGVDLVGGYADLGAEAVLEAVGEARQVRRTRPPRAGSIARSCR